MGKQVFWKITIPETMYGWTGLLLGIAGSACWCTQFVWDWFGITEADKTLYSLIVLILLISASAFTFVANRLNNQIKIFSGRTPMMTVAKITFIGFIGVILTIMVLNGGMMSLDMEYQEYANTRAGFFTGIRQLTAVTSADVGSLANFGLGIREIVKAMFLVIPCLIGTWGGLSVLTADSIDEAEGGILAIVAAFVVFIIVWIFKAIDISLMFLTI